MWLTQDDLVLERKGTVERSQELERRSGLVGGRTPVVSVVLSISSSVNRSLIFLWESSFLILNPCHSCGEDLNPQPQTEQVELSCWVY